MKSIALAAFFISDRPASAFGYQGTIDASGRLAWQSDLFDGSGHQVNVKFIPAVVAGQQSTPIKVSQPVEIEGVAPPYRSNLHVHEKLLCFGFFLFFRK